MNIEKEYNIDIDDQIILQQYLLEKHSKGSYFQWLIIYAPLIYILFSSYYSIENIIKIMGLIISICLIIYYIIISIFSDKINKHFLRKYMCENYIPNNIKLIITENSIIEYANNSEFKIIPQWVNEFIETKDYIYIMNNMKYTIILPRKYFSKEETELLKKYYKKTKYNGT